MKAIQTTQGTLHIAQASGATGRRATSWLICAATCVALGACDALGQLNLGADPAQTAQKPSTSVKMVERDVESPQVFQATEQGLWDGRPSLGGVWVAHPDADTPERVVIRNKSNGKFVIGALFRKERALPGPAFQVSSDAAKALELLAGAPQDLSVTALRRQEVEDPQASPATAAPSSDVADTAVAEVTLSEINETPIAMAAAPSAPSANATTSSAAAPSAAPSVAPASTLSKSYLQVGIFSQKANAQGTAASMRKAGLSPKVIEHSSSGKLFYRVTVGPALTQSEQNAMLKMVRGMGFKDAYAVRR